MYKRQILDDGYKDNSSELVGVHSPSGPFKGNKYSAFEGATRVPFIFYWDQHIQPAVSNALVSQVDFLASFASLIGYDMSEEQSVIDSENHLDVFLGKKKRARDYLLEESYTLNIRHKQWKFVKGVKKVPSWIKEEKGIDSGLSLDDKLFRLDQDSTESTNVIDRYPQIALELKTQLDKITQKKMQ